MRILFICIISLFACSIGRCQVKFLNMKFNAFAYCIHSNSDTSTELKWFTCSNVSIIIFTEKDSIYKRIDVNKKPDSLKIFVTSVKQHFIDKDNIAWVYLN